MRACLLAILVVWLLILQAAGCHLKYEWTGDSTTGTTTSGGSGGAPTCDADCAPVPGWLGPSLFAIGPYDDVPGCPDIAPNKGIEVYDGLSVPPLGCPVCQCEASDTACSVPTDWHASAAKCSGAGAAQATPFPAPAAWSGDCTTESAVPAGALCNGVACVQSVTVQAPTITAAPCAAVPIGGSAPPPVTWARRARECLPDDPATCPEEPPACVPESGFSMCVYQGADVPCPGSPYTERHLFHRAAEDHRSCSPCACGPPADNACITFVTAYSDAACGTVAGAIHVVSGEGEGCFDVPAGFGLAAKTAEVIAVQPGECEPSGGEPGGTAAPVLPVTVCCREEIVPE